MTSANESNHHHPLHQPPPPPPPPIASSSSLSSGAASGGAGGGGIARSAPIRTLPTATASSSSTPATATAAASAAAVVAHRGYPRGGVMAAQRGFAATAAGQSMPSSSSPVSHGGPVVGIDNIHVMTNMNMATTTAAPTSSATPYVYAPNNSTATSGQRGLGTSTMYPQGYDPYSSSQSAPTTSTHTNTTSSSNFANTISSSSNNNSRMNDSVTTTRYTTDPVVMSRQTSDVPIMMARQGSDYVGGGGEGGGGGGGGGGGMMNTPENSAQLHPHNIQLPTTSSSQLNQQSQVQSQPPPLPQPLHSMTQTTAMHPLEQQQLQSYPPYHQQQQQQQQQQIPTSATVNTAASLYYQQPPFSASSPQHHLQQQQQQQPAPTSQGMPSIPQSVSPSKQQQQQQQLPQPVPLSPEEEVDFFLRGGPPTTTSTTTISSSAETSHNRLHPTNLPPTQSLIVKCQSLATRRAWGDVVQLTKDVLMGSSSGGIGSKAGTGGGMEGHHHHHSILYNELLRAAASSSSSSGELSSNDGVPELEDEEDRDTLRKETCEFIALRCIALLKLRRYEELRKEVTSLGLMPYLPGRRHDTTATTESATNTLAWKEGSLHSTGSKDVLPDWVPFGLRLLAAQQLQFTSTTTEESSLAVDVLYDLRDRMVVRTEYWNSPMGLEIWKGAIDNALFNSFVRSKDWRLALHTCQEMILGLEYGVKREVEWWCMKTTTTVTATTSGSIVSDQERKQMEEIITIAAHVELHSRQLLILLQAGAISAAEMIQKDVRKHATKIESQLHQCRRPSAGSTTALSCMAKEFALVRQVPIRVMVNEGLLQFSRLNYTEAAKSFLDAWNQQQQHQSATHSSYPTWKELTSPTLGFDAEPSLTEECLTNLSLCMLYSGSMHTAVDKLEGLIRDDPCLYLTEAVAFNLCTLYELGSDGEECTRKKKVLQRVAHRFFLHDIGAEMLRLG